MKRYAITREYEADDLPSIWARVDYKAFDSSVYASVLMLRGCVDDRREVAKVLRQARQQCETHRRLRAQGLVK